MIETGQQSGDEPKAAPLVGAMSLLGETDTPRGCLWRAWQAFKLGLVSLFGLFVVCVSAVSAISGEDVEFQVNGGTGQQQGVVGPAGAASEADATTPSPNPSPDGVPIASDEQAPGVRVSEADTATRQLAEALATAIDPSSTPTTAPEHVHPGEARSDGGALADLESELAAMYWEGALDLEKVRRRVEAHRWAINVEMAQAVHVGRAVWLEDLRRALELAALVAMVLLLGPLWVYRRNRSRGRKRARRLALATLPYFIAATAATLVITDVIASNIMDVQGNQLKVAAYGSPKVAATDAALHYLVYTDDEDLTELVELVAQAGRESRHDPVAAFTMVQHIWRGVGEARESTVLSGTRRVLAAGDWIVDLYGPLLALAVLVLVFRVAVPVLRNLVDYPFRAARGDPVERLRRFIWEQVKLLWREVRATLWMFLCILLFTALAVVAVRLLTYPVVVVSLKSVLATERLLDAGQPLPDIALFFTLLSVGVFLLAVSLLTLVPVGVILGKAYPVVRTRLNEKRRYRDFPVFWRSVRGILVDVVGRTVLATAICFALYLLALNAFEANRLRVWLPAPIFAPLLAVLLWRLEVIPTFWRWFRADALAESPGAESGRAGNAVAAEG